jgi:hypothetical protein
MRYDIKDPKKEKIMVLGHDWGSIVLRSNERKRKVVIMNPSFSRPKPYPRRKTKSKSTLVHPLAFSQAFSSTTFFLARTACRKTIPERIPNIQAAPKGRNPDPGFCGLPRLIR